MMYITEFLIIIIQSNCIAMDCSGKLHASHIWIDDVKFREQMLSNCGCARKLYGVEEFNNQCNKIRV